jgi:hypothetical protein
LLFGGLNKTAKALNAIATRKIIRYMAVRLISHCCRYFNHHLHR